MRRRREVAARSFCVNSPGGGCHTGLGDAPAESEGCNKISRWDTDDEMRRERLPAELGDGIHDRHERVVVADQVVAR
jgi:hypothetical protein